MTADMYAGIPVRRNLYDCADWQRMAEDLMAFQDAVQEALGTEEAGHVLDAIKRLRGDTGRRAWIFPFDAEVDVVYADGSHSYWSTHCRHDRHDACKATELAPGALRRPAQCKTCAAPCLCPCHNKPATSKENPQP